MELTRLWVCSAQTPLDLVPWVYCCLFLSECFLRLVSSCSYRSGIKDCHTWGPLVSLERGTVPKALLNYVCLPQGIKARDMLHEFMEKAIQEKLKRNNTEDHSDALDFIINSAKEHGKEFTMQELKVRTPPCSVPSNSGSLRDLG